MKLVKTFLLASLLLVTYCLQAQDDDFFSEDSQPPQPTKWLTMSSAGLTMGFAEGWETHEDAAAMVGVSPDGKIRISATISQYHSVSETVANLHREFSSWCEGLELVAPQATRQVNGLTLLSTGGSATVQGAPMEVGVEILETPINGDNGIVVIATYGFTEGMKQHIDGILLALASLKRAE